ncbi:RICIN domain-containing protein [Bacillus paranthracis]|uniref:RICIN domain-containing protein n=1 Tax=Bacillus paranthracis TaxID=2026186 RepID=UPI00146C083F|nr:RICIN domain-containing protein [Bacillus paranthracis]NMW17207.1 hypothetical protein [Bacillus paranthracis]
MVNIDKDKFYKIENIKYNKVLAISAGGTDNAFIYTDLGSDDQRWAFFKLDDESYRIVNKSNGKTLAMTNDDVFVYPHLVTADQHWTKYDIAENMKFRNLNNYKVLAAGPSGDAFVWDDLPSDVLDQQWKISPVENLVMPNLPTNFKKLGPSPTYSSPNDQFQEDMPRVLVGAVLVPYFAVADNNIDPGTQVKRNPYYVMEHYQNWHLLSENSLPAGGEETLTLHTGIRTIDQQTITQKSGISIASDAGFTFPIVPAGRADGPFPTVTGDLKTTITEELDVSISHTTELMKEVTQTQTVRNPFNQQLQYAKFAVKDTYILRRADNSVVYEVSAVDTTSIKGASYPEDKQPITDAAKIVASRYDVTNPNQTNCQCQVTCNCPSK